MGAGQHGDTALNKDVTSHRILVLSDNDKLSRAIAWNLDHLLGEETVLLVAEHGNAQGSPITEDCFDLVVVAVSATDSEPIVTLAKASAAQFVGKIPVLIVSDRPFRPDPDARIAHLGFPFEPDELRDVVVDVLQGGSTNDVVEHPGVKVALEL